MCIRDSSHTVLDQKTYTADKDVVYKGENKRASDDTAATNVFEDAKGDVTYLSRADPVSYTHLLDARKKQ